MDSKSPPFDERLIKGIPKSEASEECTRNLLDGQQRITALWKALHDVYDDRAFYVTFDKNNSMYHETGVISISKAGKDRKTVGNPKQEFIKGWVPFRILSFELDHSDPAIKWRKEADKDDETLESLISSLRAKLNARSIPYLSLPVSTSADDAINIFIKTNQSAYHLSYYDLAVAQMQKEVEESLQNLVDNVVAKVPQIKLLEGAAIGDLVLKVTCVIQGMKPTFGNYKKLDYKKLSSMCDELADAFQWTVEILKGIGICERVRLPTTVPPRVLPALYSSIPMKPAAKRANAESLIRSYLWWAFLSNRYDRQANDRLYEDYEALKRRLSGNGGSIPASQAEKPDRAALLAAGWPKQATRLGKAILLICSQHGALDLASKKELLRDPASEYHHIFPKKVLRDHQLDDIAFRALNSMLLASPVNQEWLSQMPGDYLLSLDEELKSLSWIPEVLETHLLPMEELRSAKKASRSKVKTMYNKFLKARAAMVQEEVNSLLGQL